MIWAKQTEGWGMGNFINCTPAIKALADRYERKIPVYFEESYLEEMFMDCPFMEILTTMPQEHPTVDSKWTNQTIPDWEYILSRTVGPIYGDVPHTYVDRAKVKLPLLSAAMDNYAVIIRGGILGRESEKDPGLEAYKIWVERNRGKYRYLVYLGFGPDTHRWEAEFFELFDICIFSNMRRKLQLIDRADYVLSNDTGLYHAAGAMQKEGKILWMHTPIEKNKSPNVNFEYVYITHNPAWKDQL